MVRTPTDTETPKISCEVCKKEVARSEARSAEAQDYVLYFCGIDCYEDWLKNREDMGPPSQPPD